MSKTTAQLARRVLERLKVNPAGETPTAEDSQTIQDWYAAAFGEMKLSGLTYWDQSDIPDEAFEALADYAAERVGSDWGVQVSFDGESRLRRLASQGSTGRVVTGSYF